MDELIEAISSSNGFDVFEEIEEALSDGGSKHARAERIFEAVAGRCKSDPLFRQDLIDLNILVTILNVLGTETCRFPEAIIDICGEDQSIKSIFGEFGVVREYRSKLCDALAGDSGYEIPAYIPTMVCLLSGSENIRKEVFCDKPLLELIITRLADAPVGSSVGLLDIVSVLLAGDDPSTVFMRDSLIQYIGGFEEFCGRVLEPMRDGSPSAVLSILPHLCNSHTHCASLIEHGWFKWVIGKVEDPGTVRGCAKFFRSLSFDDESKDVVLKRLESKGVLFVLLSVSLEDAIVSSHTFGMLANICMRNTPIAEYLYEKNPSLGELIERVVSQSPCYRSMNELTQCMQFLRSLAKSPTAHAFLTSLAPLFTDRKINDKTICRIRDEIFIGG